MSAGWGLGVDGEVPDWIEWDGSLNDLYRRRGEGGVSGKDEGDFRIWEGCRFIPKLGGKTFSWDSKRRDSVTWMFSCVGSFESDCNPEAGMRDRPEIVSALRGVRSVRP